MKYETLSDLMAFLNLLFIKTYASYCRHKSKTAFIAASTQQPHEFVFTT